MDSSEPDDFDGPWKEALHGFFREFLQLLFPKLHRAIDWNVEPEFLDKEFQQIAHDAESGRTHADTLVKVSLKTGEELRLLVHTEVQGARDNNFPKRMYVYNYRAFDKYQLRVVSLAVLTDDSPVWRPESFDYALSGFHLSMTFPVAKLNDFREPSQRRKLERCRNPFALLVLAHLKTQETKGDSDLRTRAKVDIIRSMLRQGFTRVRIRRLFNFVDWVMRLPDNKETLFLGHVRKMEEEFKMPFMNAVERIGFEKGEVRSFRIAILDILTENFGSVSNFVSDKLDAINDATRLRALTKVAIKAKSLDEFLSRL